MFSRALHVILRHTELSDPRAQGLTRFSRFSWFVMACCLPIYPRASVRLSKSRAYASAQSVTAASCSQTRSLSLIPFWACRPPPQSLIPLSIIWQSGYHRGSELVWPEWGLTVCLSTTLLGAAAGPEATQRPEELASNCETKETQEKYKQCERTCPLVSAKMRDLSNEQDKCSSGQDLKGLGQDLSIAEMFFMSAFLLHVLPGTLTPPTQPPLPPFLPIPYPHFVHLPAFSLTLASLLILTPVLMN